MASRASIAAGGILLISLVVVFALVANNGVSTGVYLPDQPTHTPAPTAGPSPTPLPDPAVENWQESTPGRLSYVPRPESGAQVFYNVTTLEEFAGNLGIDPPADDAPMPALNILQTMREGFEEQIAELGLDAGPEAIDGPATVLVNGVPVSRLRIQLDAAETESGPFPGLDLVIGIFDRPGDEVQLVQYRLQAPPDPAIYNDFYAWLEARVVELSGAEATETPTGDEATDEPEAEGEDAAEDEPSGDAETPSEDAETAPTVEAPADETETPEADAEETSTEESGAE